MHTKYHGWKCIIIERLLYGKQCFGQNISQNILEKYVCNIILNFKLSLRRTKI